MSRFSPLPLLILLSGCKEPVAIQGYLSLLNISPPGGSANIDVDVAVVATFSEQLVSDSVSPVSAYIEDADGQALNADLSYDDDTWTVYLTPTESLIEATTYTTVFSTGISGQENGALAQEVRASFTTEGTIVSSNEPPVAVAGGSATVAVGEEVSLDGSESYDPEGESITFLWELVESPDGSDASLDSSTASDTSFIADVEGTFLVSLTVNDGSEDSDKSYAQITAESSDDGDGGDDGDDTGVSDDGGDEGGDGPADEGGDEGGDGPADEGGDEGGDGPADEGGDGGDEGDGGDGGDGGDEGDGKDGEADDTGDGEDPI
jgi:hypothetical protein